MDVWRIPFAAALLLATPAAAGSFDPAGRFSMDGPVAVGFEAGEADDGVLGWQVYAPPGNIEVLDETWAPASVDFEFETALRPDWIRTDPAVALEGESVLVAGGGVSLVIADLRAPELEGRRVEVRLWQRAEGTVMGPALSWILGEAAVFAGGVSFFPTGRATTDGWREWTSGPVDWAFGGAPGVVSLALFDQQIGYGFTEQIVGGQSVAFAPYFLDARVLVDAIEVIDLGPAAVPAASCRLADEADTCGAHGVCSWGRCVDAAAVVGRLMTGDFRSQYLARRAFEIDRFGGARQTQARSADVAAALDAVDRDDVGARELWSTIRHVYNTLLADGHSRPPEIAAPSGALGVCLHLGQADLLPGSPAPVPMVFEVAEGSPLAELLEPGDVLVSADGLPPAEWVEAAALYLLDSGDPRALFNAAAPRIIPAALQTGADLVFQRCSPAGEVAPCAAGEVEEIRVDFAEAVAEIWAERPATPEIFNFFGGPPCDFRFRRIAPDAPLSSATWSWADDDGVRLVETNGHFVSPVSQVDDALGEPHPRIVYDHRWGLGGVRQTESYIGSFLMGENDVDGYEVYPPIDGELTEELRGRFRACLASGTNGCGDAAIWEASDLGGGWVNAGSRLAIVNSFDVSSSDFISMRLSLRQSGETRVFGVGSTHGAFGTYLPPPAYGGERSGPWIGREDLMFVVDGTPTGFLNGTGVPPDEEVLQRQSDAVQGIDTLLEAAEAWVRQ